MLARRLMRRANGAWEHEDLAAVHRLAGQNRSGMNRVQCQSRAAELDAQLPDGVRREAYPMLARHWRDLAAADLERPDSRDV